MLESLGDESASDTSCLFLRLFAAVISTASFLSVQSAGPNGRDKFRLSARFRRAQIIRVPWISRRSGSVEECGRGRTQKAAARGESKGAGEEARNEGERRRARAQATEF